MITRIAISSLFVYVLLVGVTLAIIIGFVSYVMGVWSLQGTYRTLLVYPDTRIDTDNKILILHIINRGSVSATIYKIIIRNVESLEVNITVHPGDDIVISEPLNGEYKPGMSYVVEIYTKEGDILKQPVYIPIKAG